MIAETGLAAELQRLEALALIDWPAAAAARYRILRTLFERHASVALDRKNRSAAAQSFAEFRKQGGEALEDHARFEALHAQRYAADPAQWNWRRWPQAWRDPGSAEVEKFAAAHADEIRFHAFLQWLADRGLADAQRAAREAGMAIGLIGDLAVGTDGGGSHSWSRQHAVLVGLSVGAPPDLMNGLGQNWGLTAFSPRGLRASGYAPFIEMLRANLRHAGGLRIDHVLGLARLWLVPEGASANEGAYLHYPLTDMLRLIALESWRHRAVIVGEDLGTVPDGFRDQLDGAGIMGMRVLWFERAYELFVEPARWSSTAMATPTTHDLPTVAGWWAGRDIDWRSQLAQLPPDSSEAAERDIRERERHALWDAFRYAEVAQGEAPAPQQGASVIDAALKFVARTPAPLAIMPIEDIVGLDEQPNLPGTIDQHPNWRRRLPAPAADLFEAPAAAARLLSLREERPVK
ncbi:MAG: 4-alpha-glucanotransferase [Nevskia sp.]|nr:4-alpha-glucanotransferase [Nevskia sp.]